MLTIYVPRTKMEITVEDKNKKIKVYPMLVYKKEDELGQLQDQECKSFADVKDVQILVQKWYFPTTKFLDLELPTTLKQGIIKTLKLYNGMGNKDFCCFSFVCLVGGVEQENTATNTWDFHNYHWWDRKVGDTVFLLNEKPDGAHTALYIGHGLYISVYGKGGDLEIATLRDMKKTWSTKKVLVGTPR